MQEKEKEKKGEPGPMHPETGKTGGQGDVGKTGGQPDWEKKDKDKAGERPTEVPR